MMARVKQNLEEFINLYRDSPCLWQMSSKDYHNRPKKEAAYGKLVEKMKELEPQANKDYVIKKINNIRSTFRKEMKKVKESVLTGCAEEVYRPKLWYFEHLLFLTDQENLQPSSCNMDNDEYESEGENETTASEYATERSIEPIDEDAQSPTTKDDLPHQERRSVASASQSRPRQLKRMAPLTPDTLICELSQPENENLKRPRLLEDRHDIFGKHVANVLRDVTTTQRILAEKFINDVLFEAQLGNLSFSHMLTQGPNLS